MIIEALRTILKRELQQLDNGLLRLQMQIERSRLQYESDMRKFEDANAHREKVSHEAKALGIVDTDKPTE